MKPDVWDYREDLQNLAQYLCRDPDDAEDVAHAALLKAVQNLDTFRGEASVRTWLHAITTNECRMLRRRKSPTSLDDYLDQVVEGRLGPVEPDPEELAIELETRREVMDGLAALPGNYRCALLLKDGQGLTVGETARLMDTTPAAVRSILYRARQTLREAISA